MSTDIEPTSTIVEIAPEITAVFGDIPEGLEPIDFGLLPEFDRAQLTTALSAIGSTAAITGATAQAMTAAQGLYRVTAETQKLLSAGATMALKDGAHIGAVMRNGKIIAQARFIPIGTGAAAGALAAIGPALAMVALQMALSDVTTAVKTNTALLNQTLTTIRNEQWAELTGHVETMERATTHAKEIGAVPETLWQRIAPYEATLRKHMERCTTRTFKTTSNSLTPLTAKRNATTLRTSRTSYIEDVTTNGCSHLARRATIALAF